MLRRLTQWIKGAYKCAQENMNHVLLGAVIIGIGLFLISKQDYFSWPPMIAPVENDDTFGSLFVLAGVAMIWWALSKHKTARANHIILSCAAGLMAILTFFQFFHWLLLDIPMPWISNLGILGVIMLLADRSDSK